MQRALVVGFGVTGRAVTRALRAHDDEVIVVEDAPTDAVRDAVAKLGVVLVESPSATLLHELVRDCDFVLPSPGVPESHPVFIAAATAHVPVRSEFDLAAQWDDRPIVAVTGTDGKTTVTTLITSMLEASGVRAVACGNTDTPLIVAIEDPAIDVFVVEASSFRLAMTEVFRPHVAVWLNFAPDHLDAHDSLATYESAKARIWAQLDADHGLAIANAVDPVVLANRNPTVETITFGPAGSDADATVADGDLRLADGTHLLPVADLPRAFPHDITNALAAASAAAAVGATIDGIRTALRSWTVPPHRVQRIGARHGIEWYDDSKATTPHAALTAIASFPSVVLVAGGRNKGLDLSVLGAAVPPVRGVIAIGEAAGEIAAAFDGRCSVVTIDTDITDAVSAAATMAEPGDVVLLSPACASFDWFDSYAARGDAFAAAARLLPDFVDEVAP